MAALDDFTTAMTSAATYLAARDYSNARLQVMLARIHLARVPNSAADGVSAQWREDLANIEASITMESGRQTRSVTASCEFVR
jgi:hypothetical protein